MFGKVTVDGEKAVRQSHDGNFHSGVPGGTFGGGAADNIGKPIVANPDGLKGGMASDYKQPAGHFKRAPIDGPGSG
jgi:hypothetical protein